MNRRNINTYSLSTNIEALLCDVVEKVVGIRINNKGDNSTFGRILRMREVNLEQVTAHDRSADIGVSGVWVEVLEEERAMTLLYETARKIIFLVVSHILLLNKTVVLAIMWIIVRSVVHLAVVVVLVVGVAAILSTAWTITLKAGDTTEGGADLRSSWSFDEAAAWNPVLWDLGQEAIICGRSNDGLCLAVAVQSVGFETRIEVSLEGGIAGAVSLVVVEDDVLDSVSLLAQAWPFRNMGAPYRELFGTTSIVSEMLANNI